MEYHLNREVRYSEDSEHSSLYKWYLQEYTTEGNKVGRPLIPWGWSFYFQADNLHYRKHIGLKIQHEKDKVADVKNVTEEDVIQADLIPGRYLGKRHLSDRTTFSMFGADRKIERLNLSIRPVDEDAAEDCTVWGYVSFTAEIDFRNEVQDDLVEVQVFLKASRFQKLVEAISSGAVDSLSLRINGVHGFYSEWSPSIKTDAIKILTAEDEHKVQIPDGASFVPPRLGRVGECDLYTYKKANLDSAKLFQESSSDEDDVDESKLPLSDIDDGSPQQQNQNLVRSLIDQVVRNQKSILALRIPLWIIALALIIRLFSK